MNQVIQSGMANLLFDQDGPFPGDASPINLITSSFPPTCIVSATNDTLIPVDHSKGAAAKLQEKGVDSLLVSCEGMGHGEAECYPGQPWQDRWWDDAIKPSLDFAIQRM
jgi:acetyl esterase/lipase